RNNNVWATKTPLEQQTAAARLSDKAIGYGMPALRVDGHDVLAVYEAMREGVERARAGEGPTFVEAVSYRSGPHARCRRCGRRPPPAGPRPHGPTPRACTSTPSASPQSRSATASRRSRHT